MAFSLRDYEFISRRAYWRPTMVLTLAIMIDFAVFIVWPMVQHRTELASGSVSSDFAWELLVFWAIALPLGLRQMMLAEVRLRTADIEFPNMGKLFMALGLLVYPIVLIASVAAGDSIAYRRYVAMRIERAARATPRPPASTATPASPAIPGLLKDKETRW